MLCKATATLVALERFFACVVPHMPHQRALLPEASAAELAHVGLFFQMCPEVHLLGILGRPLCHSLFSTVTPYPQVLEAKSKQTRLGRGCGGLGAQPDPQLDQWRVGL